MPKKVDFLQKVQSVATSLAQAVEDAQDLNSVFFDRGYNSGGIDPLVDADVSPYGVTAADVNGFITLAQQLANLANNAAVATGDYSVTWNKLRTDV